MTTKIALLFAMLGFAGINARGAQASASPFAARYKAGDRMTYLMEGVNENWKYQVQALGVVRMDSKGGFAEEYTWSHFVSNGAAVALPSSGAEFRELVSLDPDKPPSMPNLAAAPPMLIGPITDLATFYVDLWLATSLGGKLSHAGDHADLNLGIPGSWADGNRVEIGESAVDFDFTLLKVDEATNAATLLVRHVPPAQLRVQLPAPWMCDSVSGGPDNWVQVTTENGKFIAGVGKETFDVRMKVSLVNGKILSATMENLVKGREGDCQDRALTNCGNAYPFQISRHIEISLKD